MSNVSDFEMISPLLARFYRQKVSFTNYSSSTGNSNKAALTLYKHLMRQCDKLPKGAKEHYKFQIRQVWFRLWHIQTLANYL